MLQALIVIPFVCLALKFSCLCYRKKPDSGVNSHVTVPQSSGTIPKIHSLVKKKRPPPKAPKQNSVPPVSELESLRLLPIK
jgi:hypothetical protein